MFGKVIRWMGVLCVFSLMLCGFSFRESTAGERPVAALDLSFRYITAGNSSPDLCAVFVLEGEDEETPMPAGSTGNRKVLRTERSGTLSFGEICYMHPDLYRYTIRRAKDPGIGREEDCSEYQITVAVMSDGQTSVIARRTGEDAKTEILYRDRFESGQPETGDDGGQRVFAGAALAGLGGWMMIRREKRRKREMALWRRAAVVILVLSLYGNSPGICRHVFAETGEGLLECTAAGENAELQKAAPAEEPEELSEDGETGIDVVEADAEGGGAAGTVSGESIEGREDIDPEAVASAERLTDPGPESAPGLAAEEDLFLSDPADGSAVAGATAVFSPAELPGGSDPGGEQGQIYSGRMDSTGARFEGAGGVPCRKAGQK